MKKVAKYFWGAGNCTKNQDKTKTKKIGKKLQNKPKVLENIYFDKSSI